MSWANHLFQGLGENSGSVTWLIANINTEIAERISKSMISYTMELKKDTFKPDIVFNSFHHQVKTPISDRALLVGS